jgi:hypothetical protein
VTNYESNSFHVEDATNDTSAAFSTLPPDQSDGDAVLKLWHTTQLPDGQPLNVSVLFGLDDIRGLQSFLNDRFGRGKVAPGVQTLPDSAQQTVETAIRNLLLEGFRILGPNGVELGSEDLPEHGITVARLADRVAQHQPDVDLFQEQAAALMERCWCGGEVGPRVPGDELGLGCLANIMHDWRAASAKSQRLINHERYVANHEQQNDASDPHFFTDSGNSDCMCGESEGNPVHFVNSSGDTAHSPSSYGNPTNEPADELPPTGIPQPVEAQVIEPEKPKRKRRTKVEIAYDTAKDEYERAAYGGTVEQASAASAALSEAREALRAKDPGNSRLSEELNPTPPAMDPEVAEVLSNNETRTSGPSFAAEASGFPAHVFDGPQPLAPGVQPVSGQVYAPDEHGGIPAQAFSGGFAPGQAPQLGAVEISPQEQQAASGFPCPVQSSDGRTCQRPYGHEIQTSTNPEPKPHVYATVPSQLGITTAQAVQAVEQSLPAFQAAGHPAPTGQLSFQVPPTPAEAPTHAPSGAEMQPPAPAAPFWQQPQGGQ